MKKYKVTQTLRRKFVPTVEQSLKDSLLQQESLRTTVDGAVIL